MDARIISKKSAMFTLFPFETTVFFTSLPFVTIIYYGAWKHKSFLTELILNIFSNNKKSSKNGS